MTEIMADLALVFALIAFIVALMPPGPGSYV